MSASAKNTATSGNTPRLPSAWAGLLIVVLLAALWTPAVSEQRGMGWDESMHVGLPAARMAVGVTELDFGSLGDTLLGCHQYPFVYPVVLAANEVVFGVSTKVARRTGRVVWVLTLWGIFLVVRRAMRRAADARGVYPRGADAAPWLALMAGAASPLALGQSGSLYLEVPFACASVFAVLAWLQREPPTGPRQLAPEVVAGAVLTVAFFTKFNYGLLLCLGLGLDFLCDLASAIRHGRTRDYLLRAAALAMVPFVALVWWFLLPWPGDFEIAALHRERFVGFLFANQGLPRFSTARRILHWTTYVVVSPRAFMLYGLGCLAALPNLLTPGVRTLWFVAAAFVVPITWHDFHLVRFLVPASVALFALVGVGLAALLPRNTIARVATVAIALVAVGIGPSWDGEWMAEQLGILSDDDTPEIAAYKRERLAAAHSLSPWRGIPTGGMSSAELEAFLDLVGGEVGADERPGWIGVSNEVAPGALFLGLLERDWTRAAFLAYSDDEPGSHYVTIKGVDPEWSDARFAEFANAHDVVFYSDPIDIKDRKGRRFMSAYRDRLLALGWEERELGSVDVERAMQAPLRVRLFAARP